MTSGMVETNRSRRLARRISDALAKAAQRVVAYAERADPTVGVAFLPAFVIAAVLYVRSPFSNYIFDEQEALLANPFVNGKIPFKDVLTRDFWGLPHD